VENYYRPAPLKKLLPLAASTILLGEHFNPTGVGGLEIAVYTMDKIYKLSPEELAELRQGYEILDENIRKVLPWTS